MSDRVHIPSFDYNAPIKEALSSMHWSQSTDGHVVVSCPNAHRHPISRHTIEPNGEVNASLLCQECGWHVFGVLDNWTAENQALWQSWHR